MTPLPLTTNAQSKWGCGIDADKGPCFTFLRGVPPAVLPLNPQEASKGAGQVHHPGLQPKFREESKLRHSASSTIRNGFTGHSHCIVWVTLNPNKQNVVKSTNGVNFNFCSLTCERCDCDFQEDFEMSMILVCLCSD